MTRPSRERKKVRSARKRAAFHAGRIDKAGAPAEKMKAAQAALNSAVVHAPHPGRAARSVTLDLAGHTRQILDKAEPSESSRALYESKLTEQGTDREKLGRALMCLRAAIGCLDDAAERDRLYELYATHLSREARAIETGR